MSVSVDDVAYYLGRLLNNGGSRLGELIEKEIEGVGVLTVVYARDPEGNLLKYKDGSKCRAQTLSPVLCIILLHVSVTRIAVC